MAVDEDEDFLGDWVGDEQYGDNCADFEFNEHIVEEKEKKRDADQEKKEIFPVAIHVLYDKAFSLFKIAQA